MPGIEGVGEDTGLPYNMPLYTIISISPPPVAGSY